MASAKIAIFKHEDRELLNAYFIYAVIGLLVPNSNASTISASVIHTIAADNEGQVWTFGDLEEDHVNPSVLKKVEGLKDIVAVSAGFVPLGLALDKQGNVGAFGKSPRKVYPV